MTYMTIPSTISGGPSIFQVRMGTGEVLSPGDQADFLVAFYQHSYENHRSALRDGGVLIYDSDHVKPDEDERRFIHAGVPITGLTVEAVGGSAKEKGKNIFTLGLLARVFSLNVEKLHRLLKERFGSKSEDVLRNAMVAFDAGYAYGLGDLVKRSFHFAERDAHPSGRPMVTMDGNQAIVYGLITAGVRFGAGYPITPWSTIMEQLRTELPKYGGTFIQAEDELAAVSMAIGFSYAGHLAVTGSSGPGISLKTEALGWAVMAEIPLIVINVARGGPSTGLPTNVEQSDLMQAIYGSHGDSPKVVIAPRNVGDCYYCAVEAARIARKYSVPVLVLSDQALSSRIEAFAEPDLEKDYVNPELDLTSPEEGYKPYPLDGPTRHVPPGTILKAGKYPTVTGLEHDEFGHPTGSPSLHMKMTARRRDKLKRFAAEIPRPVVYGDEEGDILLVGWGSTYGPIHEAVDKARAKGMQVGQLHLRHLNPMANGLERIFARFRQIFVIEMNDEGLYGFGQLATILRGRYANPNIRSITKTDGLTFKVSEILEGIERLRGDHGATVSDYPQS